MLNALRLNQGFPVNLFQDRTGLLLNSIEKELQLAEKRTDTKRSSDNFTDPDGEVIFE
jgi:hypothetical protein